MLPGRHLECFRESTLGTCQSQHLLPVAAGAQVRKADESAEPAQGMNGCGLGVNPRHCGHL
eukprot:6008760-Prymnesium_polylepis.1